MKFGILKVNYSNNLDFIQEDPLKTSEKSKYKCETCGKSYKQALGLKEHINSVHKGLTLKCEYCGKDTFKHNTNLQRHIKLKHEKIKTEEGLVKIIKCDEYGKSYDTPFALRKHLNRSHQKPELTCKLCEKAFGDPSRKKLTLRQVKNIIISASIIKYLSKLGLQTIFATIDKAYNF